jgi:hypothetical protein
MKHWVAIFRLFLLTALLGTGLRSMASNAEATTITVTLKQTSISDSPSFAIDHENVDVRFIREPKYTGDKIIRGFLYRNNTTNDYMGLAIDEKAGRLYLDLNCNLDLTDDPAGVHEASERNAYMLRFSNFTVEMARRQPARSYTLSLNLYLGGGAYLNSNLQTGWVGELELPGRRWRLSVIDNMDGIIDATDKIWLMPLKPESLQQFGDSQFAIGSSDQLFLNGHLYQTRFDWEASPAGPLLRVSLGELPFKPATLALAGQGITRLLLKNSRGGPVVVLDQPGASITLPEGRYRIENVLLHDPKNNRLYQQNRNSQSLEISATDGQPALRLGAPLNNTLTARRAGSTLQLNYELHGIGAESYQPVGNTRDARPKFRILHAGTQVAEGFFEYG